MLGSDSREHEDLWSSYGTGAHDDLSLGEDVVVFYQPNSALALEPHPPRSPVQDDHPLHERVLEVSFMLLRYFWYFST